MATAFPKTSLATRHPDGSAPLHWLDAMRCDGCRPAAVLTRGRLTSGQPVRGQWPRRARVSLWKRCAPRPRRRSSFLARRFLALIALAVCLVAGSAAMATASGRTLPSGQHEAVPVEGRVNPDMHTCDDPDNPCYTAPQMHSYLVHCTHRFYHLSQSFRFPASFIHLAQTAHATWCTHHPIMCRAQKAQWRADAIAHPRDSCGQGWWCHERGLISCAGGGMEPYWSCEGAYHQDTAQELDHKLTTTDKMLIVGGDTMVCFLFPPGAPIVIGSGIVQMFNVWIASS
jgi:hypothetical protein